MIKQKLGAQNKTYFGSLKIALLLVLTFLFFADFSFAQKCGMNSIANSSGNQLALGLDEYSLEACEALVVKCNLIVLRRDDGTGGIDQNYVNSIISNTNSIFGNITDDGACEVPPEYPLDSHIKLDFKVSYENNTSAWDYYAKAKSIGAGYFQDFFDPLSLAVGWPELDAVVQGYKSQYPDRLQIVIVENGAQLDYYEDALINNPNITVPWRDFDPSPDFSEILMALHIKVVLLMKRLLRTT